MSKIPAAVPAVKGKLELFTTITCTGVSGHGFWDCCLFHRIPGDVGRYPKKDNYMKITESQLEGQSTLDLQKATVMLLGQILAELKTLNDSQSVPSKPPTPDAE